MWKINYYYTFEEVNKPTSGTVWQPIDHTGGNEDLATGIKACYATVPSWADPDTPGNTDYAYLEELYERLRVMFKRPGYYFWVSKKEYDVTDSTDLTNLHTESFGRLVNFYDTIYQTKDKYIALIKIQENNKANILTDIQKTVQTKFNDTPQGSGDFSGDTHTSTITTSTETLPEDLLAKLNRADKFLEDIYDTWIKEFKKFIILD